MGHSWQPDSVDFRPHLDDSGRIALVHNGVIENHETLRTWLQAEGVQFSSETDSESLAQLIGFLYTLNGDFIASVREALGRVEGTFGVSILCNDHPDLLVAARRGSSLIAGIGDGEHIVASDASAIVAHTHDAIFLDDDEVLCLTPDTRETSRIDRTPVEKSVYHIDVRLDDVELGGFEHHMLKEIFEQPRRLEDCLNGRLSDGRETLKLRGLEELQETNPDLERVLLFGCGTAWHAALVGRYLIEELARIPCQVEYASELRYRNPIIAPGTLAVPVSQSGETADTLAALEEVVHRGAASLGVVNAVGSMIARKCDSGVYLHAGTEVGVASTKAFTSQIAVLTLVAAALGRQRKLPRDDYEDLLDHVGELPAQLDEALTVNGQVRDVAQHFVECENWLYHGRGINYPVALEGALTLKEVSYVHAEGMPAAEMKHGPIAMIDSSMPVVTIAARDHTYSKVVANIEEVRSRGGRVIAVTSYPDPQLSRLADSVICVPRTLPVLTPILMNIPLQLLAYHMAALKGLDADRPRNLAKSVTVE